MITDSLFIYGLWSLLGSTLIADEFDVVAAPWSAQE